MQTDDIVWDKEPQVNPAPDAGIKWDKPSGAARARGVVEDTPTLEDKVISSLPGRIVKGIKDPIDAGAQMLTGGLGAVTSGFGYFPNSVSNYLNAEKSKLLDDSKRSEDQYERARKLTGQSGFDGGRTIGNVLNLGAAAVSGNLPAAATTLGRVATGLVGGGIGGVFSPVVDGGQNFWAQKSAQVGLGAATGGIMTPVIGKAVDIAAPAIKSIMARFADPEVAAARASFATDSAINKALADIGMSDADIPPQLKEQLRSQVMAAFKSGQKIDPAAALRKADAEAQGLPILQGQMTRDPLLFSREKNLRGIESVGDPIRTVMQEQNAKLTRDVTKFGGLEAKEAYPAGKGMVESLSAADEQARKKITAAYTAARESSGKDWDIPLQGISQQAQQTLDDFGDKVPSAIITRLKSFGAIADDGMQQKKVFNYEEADKLLKLLNQHHSNDPVTNTALGQIAKSVKQSILEGGGDGDPFAAGRLLAKQRFGRLDAAPGLNAAVSGTVAPDDFVRRFITNGKVEDLQALAKEFSPDQLSEARKQIAGQIYRAAFGENASGNKAIAPENTQKVLRNIGTDKLKIFFSQQEIDELRRISRLSSYFGTEPAAGFVAHGGNPGGVLFSQIARIPGFPQTGAILGALAKTATSGLHARSAMDSTLKKTADITPEQVRALSQAITYGGLTAGSEAAGAVR